MIYITFEFLILTALSVGCLTQVKTENEKVIISQQECIGDCLNGTGTFHFSNGKIYEGQWKDGKREGQGTFSLPNGTKYIGQWKNDKMEGHGTVTYPGGEQYVGQLKDGKREGQGTFSFPDGTKYIGQWKDGRMHGQGILYDANRTIKQQGKFVNGKFIGQ